MHTVLAASYLLDPQILGRRRRTPSTYSRAHDQTCKFQTSPTHRHFCNCSKKRNISQIPESISLLYIMHHPSKASDQWLLSSCKQLTPHSTMQRWRSILMRFYLKSCISTPKKKIWKSLSSSENPQLRQDSDSCVVSRQRYYCAYRFLIE
jgi:hypothetical protein